MILAKSDLLSSSGDQVLRYLYSSTGKTVYAYIEIKVEVTPQCSDLHVYLQIYALMEPTSPSCSVSPFKTGR